MTKRYTQTEGHRQEKILIRQRAIIGAFTAFGILVAGLLITAVLSVVIHG